MEVTTKMKMKRIALAACAALALTIHAVAADTAGDGETPAPAASEEQATPVVKYSQRKMIEVLHAHDLYFQFRDFLQNTAGGVYWDMFVASDCLSTDDATFMALMPQVQAALGISGDLLAEMLNQCVATGD